MQSQMIPLPSFPIKALVPKPYLRKRFIIGSSDSPSSYIPKSKKYCLAYSLKTNNHRTYNIQVYHPHPFEIICQGRDLHYARKRISCNDRGKVKYYPSKEYIKYKNFLIATKVIANLG